MRCLKLTVIKRTVASLSSRSGCRELFAPNRVGLPTPFVEVIAQVAVSDQCSLPP
jgi:hypothetical protein